MKKIYFLCIFILCIVVMVACSDDDESQVSSVNLSNEQIADSTLETLINSITEKDELSFKEVFSEQVKNEDEDFDIEMDYLFDFFSGEVVSWEKDGGPIVSREKDHEKKVIEIKSWYKVQTSEEKYLVFFLQYVEDALNPNNIGVYALRIVKEEDKQSQMTYWQDMAIPGIYMPEE